MYNQTRYSRGIIENLSDISIARLANPIIGETVFCKENGRVLTWDGDLWMCDDFIKVRNSSGINLLAGDIVSHANTSGTESAIIVLGSSTGDVRAMGVLAYPSTINSFVAIAYKGVYLVNYNQSGATNQFVWVSMALTTGAVLGKGKFTEIFTGDTWFLDGIIGVSVESNSSASGSIRCLLKKNMHTK